MKIAIGSDHGGYALKKKIIYILKKEEHKVRDFGTYSTRRCDYPEIGFKVANAVAGGSFNRGILICKSGLGMSIVSNKVRGIRAALINNLKSARSSREHNDANVAVFAGDVMSNKNVDKIIRLWLKTDFLGGRHKKRIDQITKIEDIILKRG